jgi:uroporphyrin-III C-methyltransferase / precorrin-2 dehydrogenase / sirohydrochlorin ferrochelatase
MKYLSNLPVFLRLDGVRAVLAGDGEPAAWKAELLAAAGARLQVFAPNACERLAKAAAGAGLRLEARAWTEADFDGALLALLQTEDDGEAQRFRAAARRAGALVKVIDRPAFCDFSFGSIVERSPLVIGVSTDGAAPVFAQAVRSRVEAIVPETLRAWAEAARAWRPRWAGFSQSRRRAIWLDFADRAFANVDRPPTEADFEALSAAATRPGRLIVVGTGAGAADLLTLRAVRALQAADHVVEDGPMPPALREFGRREASVERCPEGAGAAVRAAAAERVAGGATVVALVAGDGRGTDWSGAEIVPGVAK